MVKTIKLTEMIKLDNVNVDSEPICNFDECEYFGKYQECYLHTHVWCEVFDRWYSKKYKLDKFKGR